MCLLGPRSLACVRESEDGSELLDDALERIVADGGKVESHPLHGWWRFDGQPEALLEGNRMVLDSIEEDWEAAEVTRSKIEGRVVIHPSARVESTVVRGPAVIGAGARVSDSYIGPYTSIGDGVVIDGAEIEHSVILPGASVMHLGGRLEGSVVGARAKVFRDFALPRALRVAVGAGAEVCLS
jgi:glucose-1-phosphate thymidylyltransferase